jgi:hypothetical protein
LSSSIPLLGHKSQFGDELTNELVEWLNSVDATYQADLRELNESNFARFDARLEQRIAAVDAKIDGLEARVDRRIGILEAKMDQRFAEQRERFAVFESRMTRWMFTLWTGTMLAFAGLFVAVLRSK